jgi:hypothetical protein
MAVASNSSLLHLRKAEFETLLNSAVATGGIVFTAEITCWVAKIALSALTETTSYHRMVVLGIGIATVLASRLIKNRPSMDSHAIDVGVWTGLAVSCTLAFACVPIIIVFGSGAAAGAIVAGSLVARKARRQTID